MAAMGVPGDVPFAAIMPPKGNKGRSRRVAMIDRCIRRR